MPSQTYLSFANLVLQATLTASTQAAGFPVTNLKEAGDPGLTWRSTVTTDSWVVIDLGTATPFDRFGIAWVNFSTFRIEQNTADSWGTPAYTSGTLSTALDYEHRRRRRWVTSAGNFTRRFTRIFIPAQTPTDGAPYFEIAYAWAGTVTMLPRAPQPDYSLPVEDPMLTMTADLGKWTQEIVTGESFARHSYQRIAKKNYATPGSGDEWGTWLDIDRQIVSAQRKFLYIVENWGSGAVYYMRQLSAAHWRDRGLVVAEGPWDLEEVVSGG